MHTCYSRWLCCKLHTPASPFSRFAEFNIQHVFDDGLVSYMAKSTAVKQEQRCTQTTRQGPRGSTHTSRQKQTQTHALHTPEELALWPPQRTGRRCFLGCVCLGGAAYPPDELHPIPPDAGTETGGTCNERMTANKIKKEDSSCSQGLSLLPHLGVAAGERSQQCCSCRQMARPCPRLYLYGAAGLACQVCDTP